MQTVFILGSGFSTAAGAPLEGEILRQIFEANRLLKEFAELESWLKTHLFQSCPNWQQVSDLEEVISRLELFARYSDRRLRESSDLPGKINLLLNGLINLLLPKNLSANLECYDRFASRLQPEDAVLTFNYDLVLEEAMIRQGLHVEYFFAESPFEPGTTASQPSVPVLKLHGSLNMIFCPECWEVYLGKAAKGASCPKEHRGCRPFIIAPTLFKSYSLPYQRRIWYKALEKLTAADRIEIIGYSLPSADSLTAQLLDFGYRANPNKPKVRVVNGKHPDLSRLRDVYGNSLWNSGLSFAEWASQEDLLWV